MQIQWFPGHMHKARTQIKESLPRVDLFIEVLDARLPFSSENPMIAALRGAKPCLKLLAKSDLADAARTAQWQHYLEQERGVKAKAVSTQKPGVIRRLSEVCADMLPNRHGIGKTITTMVVGIPNVGKSTLINIMAGRSIAKTGNEPAITKGQQRINIGNGIILLDTPGILWPNVENKNSGYRLATTGAIKDTAMEYDDVAFFAADYLLKNYPQALCQRYSLKSIPRDQTELLETIGRQRGCLNKRGIVDLDRVSRIFLNELCAGTLGPITLETPEMMEREKAEVLVIQAEKAANKQASRATRRAKFKAKRGESLR